MNEAVPGCDRRESNVQGRRPVADGRAGARRVSRTCRGRGGLRDSRRGDSSRVRSAVRLEDPSHPGAPRAGRRSRRRGLRDRERQGGGLHRHIRSRGHEPGHRDRKRLHGFHPARGHHRAGQRNRHRHRRLPGGRHPWDRDADHETQFPDQGDQGNPLGHQGGLPHRRDGKTGARARRHREGRTGRESPVSLAGGTGPARLQTHRQTARPSDPGGCETDLTVEEARPLPWRGHCQGGGVRGTRRSGGEGPDTRGHHPDGSRCAPRLPSTAHGDARDARDSCSGGRTPARRPARCHRYPFR